MRCSLILSKLVSSFIKKGGKETSEKLLSSVLYSLKFAHGEHYLQFLEKVFLNLIPKVALRNKRRAGISYKVPFVLKEGESLLFATLWFRRAVFNRVENSLETRILRELSDAYNHRGEAYKKREAIHQLALLNRGFVRFLR